jgi:glutamate synthase (NADPH/NADH) small chain
MSNTKNKMPEQDPQVKNCNFKEVSLGYDEVTAIDEAKDCLNCNTRPAWQNVL